MNEEIVALYEIKRQVFLNGFIQSPSQFSPALAYAHYHRVAPIFHESSANEVHNGDPFDAAYFVSRDFIEKVIQYIDDKWIAKDFKSLGFYNLETHFGGHHANRVELIFSLEYARIADRFDESVWAAIEENAPTEAKPLAMTFTPSEVHCS